MVFNLPQRKISCFTQNKIMFSLASQPKQSTLSPLLVHVPLPTVPPQLSSSTQLYQSQIRALLLKSLQEQESSAFYSKFSSSLLVKFINICSYSTSMDTCPHPAFESCLLSQTALILFCEVLPSLNVDLLVPEVWQLLMQLQIFPLAAGPEAFYVKVKDFCQQTDELAVL